MVIDESRIVPAILAGGMGSRLHPLSSTPRPKQFLKLVSGRSLFCETLLRLARAPFSSPLVLANAAHRELVADDLAAARIMPRHVIVEPCGRDTGPAVAAAALIAARSDPATMMLIAPSDHLVADAEAFADAINAGAVAAQAGAIVLFGVQPTAPVPHFGYIETVPAAGSGGFSQISRFVEKPQRAVAAALISTGNAFWNAGLFLVRADVLLAVLSAHCARILNCCRRAVADASTAFRMISLSPDGFAAAPRISLDFALIENADNLACVPLDAGWRDVGTWTGLAGAVGAGMIRPSALAQCGAGLVEAAVPCAKV